MSKRSATPWDVIPMDEGIAVAAFRLLERQLLADPSRQPLPGDSAEGYPKTPAQIALAWLITREAVVPIPKASRKAHINENLGALEVSFEADDLLRLGRLG
jgi:diketogulonate reductase-like aldo/keto reductase